jgi:hypothetical protein
MEVSSKMVDSFLNVFFLLLWVLCLFCFCSEGLDGVSKFEMSGSGIDSIIDNLFSISLWYLSGIHKPLTRFTSRPFLIHLIQLLMICQLALAVDVGFREGSDRPLRGVIPLIDIE